MNSQIRTRKQLIVLYNSEIKAADLQIGVLKEDISNLDNDIKRLKNEYGRLIYQSYKARSKTDQWMFVFASRDFYQAYKRIKHLKEINEYRREKVEKIVQKEEEKKKSIADLEALKQNRLELLIAKEAEADALLNDKNIKQQKVKTIIQRENELKNQLAAQRREWRKLNNEIKRIIAAQKNVPMLPIPSEYRLLRQRKSSRRVLRETKASCRGPR